MSKGLENLINAEPVSADYPWKDIKDDNGSGNGTPVDRVTYADYHQTFRKLLSLAGITPNGLPDNVTNGYQYVDAILSLAKRSNGVIITSVNLVLTVANVRKIIYLEVTAADRTITLPAISTMQDGDSFIIYNNGNYEVLIEGNGTNTVMHSGDITLVSPGDFAEVVVDKPNLNWVLANYKITPVVTPVVIPKAIVVLRTGGTVGTGASLIIKHINEYIDVNNDHNITTGLYTCPKAGYYKVSVQGYAYVPATCDLMINCYKNGVAEVGLEPLKTGWSGGTDYRYNGSSILLCAAGDTIGIYLDLNASQTCSVHTAQLLVEYVNQ